MLTEEVRVRNTRSRHGRRHYFIEVLAYLGPWMFYQTDEAALWAETIPDMARLFPYGKRHQNLSCPFPREVLFRFVQDNSRTFDTKIQHLTQGRDEVLTDYYKRVTALINVSYWCTGSYRQTRWFLLSQHSRRKILSTVIRVFIRGFADDEIRQATLRNFAQSEQSLHGLYRVASEICRFQLEMARYREKRNVTPSLTSISSFMREICLRRPSKL